MSGYRNLTENELKEEYSVLKQSFDQYKAKGLSLNMARGKPGPEQLDLSAELLTKITGDGDYYAENGFDCRNYGLPEGIPEIRRLFSQLLDVSEDMIVVGGNSSLNLMFDYISQAMTHGTGAEPWLKQDGIKFICPSPGYDRHFAVTEYFGLKLIPVAMLPDGPDMDEVERLVKDEKVKGMWCVPKYSNPQGYSYSDETVRRIAALKPAAKDFRVMWDNAYVVHSIGDKEDKILNIFDLCRENGNEDMVVEFASTSKISFPGAAVAVIAASKNNVEAIRRRMSFQTICFDKLNQLRHAKMFPDVEAVREHMRKHSALLTPKFDMIEKKFTEAFDENEIISWTIPNGGYFISVDTLPGCAKRTIELCKEAGVAFTAAGAAYPYGKDPLDNNIRIAPSFPPIGELETATDIFIVCVKMATIEMLLD